MDSRGNTIVYNYMQRERTLMITVAITMLALLLAEVVGAVTLTVNAGGGADYSSIQDAIDNASAGDTIEVHIGTYYENVNVNKQLTLRGIGMPEINAGGSGSAITLAADGIHLEGFIAARAGDGGAGIMVTSNNNILRGNNVSSNYSPYDYDDSYIFSRVNGIFLVSSNNNSLIGNNANSNVAFDYVCGISLLSSNHNTLINNNANSNFAKYGNGVGIYLSSSNDNTLISNNANLNFKYGIILSDSSNNSLVSNNASSNYGLVTPSPISTTGPGVGISLSSSSNNTLIGNNASWNYENNYSITGILFEPLFDGIGISLFSSSNNLIYNNIFNNTHNVELYASSINQWNISKQSGTNIIGSFFLGGNFWGNPSSTGFSQNCPDLNNDGICDEPYILNGNNIDYLPLSYDPPSISFTITTPTKKLYIVIERLK